MREPHRGASAAFLALLAPFAALALERALSAPVRGERLLHADDGAAAARPSGATLAAAVAPRAHDEANEAGDEDQSGGDPEHDPEDGDDSSEGFGGELVVLTGARVGNVHLPLSALQSEGSENQFLRIPLKLKTLHLF